MILFSKPKQIGLMLRQISLVTVLLYHRNENHLGQSQAQCCQIHTTWKKNKDIYKVIIKWLIEYQLYVKHFVYSVVYLIFTATQQDSCNYLHFILVEADVWKWEWDGYVICLISNGWSVPELSLKVRADLTWPMVSQYLSVLILVVRKEWGTQIWY